MKKLKKCPFCKSRAKLYHEYDRDDLRNDSYPYSIVRCTKCPLHGERDYLKEIRAIDSWNSLCPEQFQEEEIDPKITELFLESMGGNEYYNMIEQIPIIVSSNNEPEDLDIIIKEKESGRYFSFNAVRVSDENDEWEFKNLREVEREEKISVNWNEV